MQTKNSRDMNNELIFLDENENDFEQISIVGEGGYGRVLFPSSFFFLFYFLLFYLLFIILLICENYVI